jgi:DNA-directed RNA polymerase specialized sigma24 family protein
MTSNAGARGPGEERRWELTPEALASLLAFLGPDEDEAARAYERIRRRLVQIFDWRGCPRPEELADETFNRVAHKLAGGLEVEAEDPLRYFCGVAYRVFKEVLREKQREREALAEVRHMPPPAGNDSEEETRLVCLDDCLSGIGDNQREMMLRYHTGDGRKRIDSRHALAEELEVPLNALRIRVHRLRVKLEACVRDCLKVK